MRFVFPHCSLAAQLLFCSCNENFCASLHNRMDYFVYVYYPFIHPSIFFFIPAYPVLGRGAIIIIIINTLESFLALQN